MTETRADIDVYRKNIKIYYLFSFLRDFALYTAVIIPFFVDWGGLNQFQIQTLQAWFMFWIFALEIPTGAVADYFGRKTSLSLGLLLVVIAVLIYRITPNFYIFLLAEFLFAAAVSFQSGADHAMLYETLKHLGKEKSAKHFFGRTESVRLFGIGCASILGGFVAKRYGVTAPMLFSAGVYFLAFLVATRFYEPTLKEVSESKRYINIIKNGFRFVKGNRTLRTLAWDAVLVMSSAYFVIWLYQRFLRQIGISVVWYGFFHFILVLSQILVNNSFDRLEKVFGSARKYLKYTALLAAVGYVFVSLDINIFTIVLLLLLTSGFGFTRQTYMSSHFNKMIPSSERATVLSFISMMRRTVLIFLNPAIGLLVDKAIHGSLVVLILIPLGVFFFSPVTEEMLD